MFKKYSPFQSRSVSKAVSASHLGITVFLMLAVSVIVFQNIQHALASACTSQGGGGNWTDTAKWNCGVVPDSDDTVIIASGSSMTFNVVGATSVISITINSGAKLNFDTTASRDIRVNGDATVNGTLECRGSSSGSISTTLRLNGSDGTPAAVEYGLIVSTTGFLDWQGQAQTDQDCIITASDVATPYNGYIYLQDGSETLIKNAEVSYMGANTANKYGVYANAVDLVANEGLFIESSSIHNNYDGISLGTTTGALLTGNSIYNNSNIGIVLNGSANNTLRANVVDNSTSHNISLVNGDYNIMYHNTIHRAGSDGIALDANSSRNSIKNNLITNSTAEGIDDDMSSSNNDYNYNLFANNTVAACSPTTVPPDCDKNVATTAPTYANTTAGNADYMYLGADSAGLGAGADLTNDTASALTNLGARLGYALNDNEGGGSNPDIKYNWLQQAHDAAALNAGDTVIVYANNLSSDTIAAVADNGNYITATITNKPPVVHYKLDDNVSGDAKDIIDSSGNGRKGITNDGANNTGMDCTAVGKYGKGCDFVTDDYVDLAGVQGENNSLWRGTGLTISGWFKADTLPSSGNGNAFFDNQNGIISSRYYRHSIGIRSNQIAYQVNRNNTSHYGSTAYSTTINTGAWYHVAMTAVDSGGDFIKKGYLNGVLVATQTFTGANLSSYPATPQSDYFARIGGTASNFTPWDGIIDDVRFFNYALTDAQVLTEYNANVSYPATGANQEGGYLYLTSGTNSGKYYTILNSIGGSVSLNISDTTGFAASDAFTIVDRVYDKQGTTCNSKTSNLCFTKDGSSSSPITWNASGTVIADAKNTYNDVFYADTDGTDGLEYNNFTGTFVLTNPITSGLLQGGFGFRASATHQKINWEGTTDASTIFQGTYTSATIDMGVSPQYSMIMWDETTASDIQFQARTGASTPITSGDFLGSDGTTGTYYTTPGGEFLASSHDGVRYIQYKASFSTTSTASIPELKSVNIGTDAMLLSSAYNTADALATLTGLTWVESSNGQGAAMASDTDVYVQVRSAANNAGIPGSWGSWCGTDCAGATYFTSPSSITIPNELKDGLNDQWIQYRVFFFRNSGNNKPYLDSIAFQYKTQNPPVISVTSASQSAAGTISTAYTLLDADEPDEDGIVTVGLYYERGVTLSADINNAVTTISVSDASLLPTATAQSPKTIIIDTEIITYTGKSGNDLTGAGRGAESTTATSHTSAAGVWIKAVTVSDNAGAVTGVTATAAGKTITWTAKTDINGIYDTDMSVRVVGHDGNSSKQIGYGTSSSGFEVDTSDPTGVSIVVNAGGATAAGASVTVTPIASDNTVLTMQISNSASFGADGLNALSGTSPAYSGSAITNWKFSGETDPVYFKVTDTHGNYVSTSAAAPETPKNLVLIETTNLRSTPAVYSLFVSWKAVTGNFASYDVYRKVSTEETFSFLSSVTNQQTNFYQDNSTSANTTYNYYVITRDANGNKSYQSSSVTGTTNGTTDGGEGTSGSSDVNAPVITFNASTQITNITNSRATITFETDELSDSYIDYTDIAPVDFTLSTTLAQGSPTFITAGAGHAITLTSLQARRTYYFRIRSKDALGNEGTKDACGTSCYSFTTTDVPGPSVSNVQSILITLNTVKITWTTDRDASSQVAYSLISDLSNALTYPQSEADIDPRVSSHQVQITGLASASVYYYKVVSTDANGNSTDAPSAPPYFSFSTSDTSSPVITAMVTKHIKDTSVTITFTTNETATSYADYGTTILYGTLSSNANLNTNHVFNLTGLASQTAYFFRVEAKDPGGNETIDNNSGAGYTFITLATINAVISNVLARTVSSTAVDITWTTTSTLDSQVEYSLNSNLSSPALFPSSPTGSGTSHLVSLTGLSENTRYYYKVKSDANESPVYNFLTGDTTVPVISGISAVYNDINAVVSWITDELATTQLEYGTSDAYGTTTTLDLLPTLSHAVTLTSLSTGTTYHYRVKSKDGIGNEAVSSDNSFTTNAGTSLGAEEDRSAPVISSITALSSNTSAIISWTTNKDANTQVEYGESASYGTSSTLDEILTKDHVARLTPLTASTEYHYRVKSIDSINNLAQSSDQTFTTNAGTSKQVAEVGGTAMVIINAQDTTPARISNFRVTGITEISASAQWQTNELSLTLLVYGKGGITEVRGKTGSFDEYSMRNKVRDHVIDLQKLQPGTLYSAQAIAIDEGGNVTQGPLTEFKTLGTSSADIAESSEPKKSLQSEVSQIIGEEEARRLVETGDLSEFIEKLEVYLGPPIIIGAFVDRITDTQAVMKWRTTVPATSFVDYGTTNEYGSQVRNLQFNQEHEVVLENLKESTQYHYRIKGITESGQLVSTQDLVFSTTAAPKVTNLVVNDIQEHSVLISWDTNVLSTSGVEYGAVDDEGLKKEGNDELKTAHSVFIIALKEKTKYRVRVDSRDIAGTPLKSTFAEFTTSIDNEPPRIKNFDAEGLLTERNKVQIFISWETDEPSTTLVRYDVGIDRGRELKKQTKKDENYTTNHVVILTDFIPGALYQFRAESEDRSGNKAFSEDFSLMTPLEEKNIIDIIVQQFKDAFGFLKQ